MIFFFFAENREIFAFSKNRTLCSFSIHPGSRKLGTTVGTRGGKWTFALESDWGLTSWEKKAPVQLRKFTVEFVYTQTLFLLYGDISNLWTGERNQWGRLGPGVLKMSNSVSCPWQLVRSWLEAVSVLGSVGSNVLAGGLIDQNI